MISDVEYVLFKVYSQFCLFTNIEIYVYMWYHEYIYIYIYKCICKFIPPYQDIYIYNEIENRVISFVAHVTG